MTRRLRRPFAPSLTPAITLACLVLLVECGGTREVGGSPSAGVLVAGQELSVAGALAKELGRASLCEGLHCHQTRFDSTVHRSAGVVSAPGARIRLSLSKVFPRGSLESLRRVGDVAWADASTTLLGTVAGGTITVSKTAM